MKKEFSHLKGEDRYMIEKLHNANVFIREIAKFLGRSPNTVSYEITENSVEGVYDAKKANHKSYVSRWNAKCNFLKVAMDSFLAVTVEEKLKLHWSPKTISGYLKKEFNIVCSSKAIYKFAESRALGHLLFWSWNSKKSGRKRGHWKTSKDGRIYIDERPALSGVGHFEMDFIVSKNSSFVFLVIVDRLTKFATVVKLPNRKRSTVHEALSRIFRDVEVKSITTDNDIAFTCWRELETLLQTHIYFTHPYHSWEKGLVENTNRWIRCFVPKRRDIESVTEEELDAIHTFLNDRPREVIDFRFPREYYESETEKLENLSLAQIKG